jgi:hypothetical protein
VTRKFTFYKSLTRITGTLHQNLSTCMTISLLFLLLMRNASVRICRENQNTHLMFSNFFPRKWCRLWDYGRTRRATDDNIIRRMRCACWITMATSTHSEYVMLIDFLLQQWLQERPSLLHYSTLPSYINFDLTLGLLTVYKFNVVCMPSRFRHSVNEGCAIL